MSNTLYMPTRCDVVVDLAFLKFLLPVLSSKKFAKEEPCISLDVEPVRYCHVG